MTELNYGRGHAAYDNLDEQSPRIPSFDSHTAPPEQATRDEIRARAFGKPEPERVRAVETLAAHEACARKRGRATRLRGVRGKGVCAECGKGGTRALWQVQIVKGGR
jgi:hypothetical protein